LASITDCSRVHVSFQSGGSITIVIVSEEWKLTGALVRSGAMERCRMRD
jgi:hypothetical protein